MHQWRYCILDQTFLRTVDLLGRLRTTGSIGPVPTLSSAVFQDDTGQGLSACRKVAAHLFDLDTAQPVLHAPSGVHPQVECVSVAGQAGVASQGPGERGLLRLV